MFQLWRTVRASFETLFGTLLPPENTIFDRRKTPIRSQSDVHMSDARTA